MWFRNLMVYQLDTVPNFNELEEQLSEKSLQPCGKTQMETIGWTSPYPNSDNDLFSHIIAGYALLCVGREERLLPAAVIKEAVDERVAEIQAKENREVFRKEKQRLKDELTFSLMPKAFTKKTQTYCFFDKKNRWLIIDSTSPAKCERILTLFRDTLGSLKATPLMTEHAPADCLTDWVKGSGCPSQFLVADQCEMIDPDQDGAVTRIDKQDLQQKEIQTHLQSGMRIRKVAMSFDDKLSFVIDENCVFRRIRPLSIITAARKDIHAETPIEQLDADFSLMSLEFSELISTVTRLMGGIVQPESESSANYSNQFAEQADEIEANAIA